MGNNNLKTTNDILVKVDQNNLIYIDPNSVVSNGMATPRGIEPENLVMYVNLEADLIPRSVLVASDSKNSLLSIAEGTLNFMKNANGTDYDTRWTEAHTDIQGRSSNFSNAGAMTEPIVGSFMQNDASGQSFGITDISIQVAGANFIPKVTIKFVDVRGKTLFESPENSPYAAFYHLPWPIFYLTVKGYYGKAIKYRLHLVKFNSKFNGSNGNFEVETSFIGSTYAYMADIPLELAMNAPYFYISENNTTTQFNESTGFYDVTVSKSTKGYRTLRSVYQEYISKGLLPKDFPVKTLREIIIIAGRLNKILEREIFDKCVDPKVLSGIKDFEEYIQSFDQAIQGWKGNNLSPEYFNTIEQRGNPSEFVPWYEIKGQYKNTLEAVTGNTIGRLEFILSNNIDRLEKNETFGVRRDNSLIKNDKFIVKTISFQSLKNIKKFYRQKDGRYGVDINGILDIITAIETDFVEQRNKLEADIEKKMNEIVRKKDIGIGFEPTVRNIIGVLLANAETYIRLMKDVHNKAFEQGHARKEILKSVLTDTIGEDIYPWPEVKARTSGNKESVLLYPGGKEIINKLQAGDTKLWPEVDFVENFYEVSTKKADNLTTKEGDTENINYIFATGVSNSKKDIGVLTNISGVLPYGDKSVDSIIYEIYERGKYASTLNSFSNDVMSELGSIEFDNLQAQISEDIDIVDVLKATVTDYPSLLATLETYLLRQPYYQDQLATVPYMKNVLSQDFDVRKYEKNIDNQTSYEDTYKKLSEFLKNYQPESHRAAIYPFNSSTYTSYSDFGPRSLALNGNLSINPPEDFIASPQDPNMWIKGEYGSNLFGNLIKIGDEYKQLLNTPYFHKQLYDDFTKVQVQEKYVGSAYLLLNSLPFKDLDDTILTSKHLDAGVYDETLISTIFREIAASHYIPYHLMLKWGSIYHRYKRYINDSVDIIGGVTAQINGDVFFDNLSGRTYTALGKTISRSTQADVGLHPFYHTVFHQIVNGYGFFDAAVGPTSYSTSISNDVNKIYYKEPHGATAWASFVDNSRFAATDKRFTLLPCNGYNDIDGSSFTDAEQENFRILWSIGTTYTPNYVDYSTYTFPSTYEYLKSTASTDTYSLSTNYRKVIDLIATFKPDILDIFEEAFLEFASEKLNEEIPYDSYDVSYNKFQDLLKEIVSITKNDNNDPTSFLTGSTESITRVKESQDVKLREITANILSTNNLIRLTLANPREIDNHILGGFTDTNVEHFDINPYDSSQLAGNLDNITLYLGEDLDGYYQDFFSVNNIELSEDNIKQFRSLIYNYAGQRASSITPTKATFITHLKDTIVSPTKNDVTGVSGQDIRTERFLTRLIERIQKDLKSEQQQVIQKKRGYSDDLLKLELYNMFKSFNDKWTAGNSIGQRTLMEEFLFLDKANRDIGDSVYLDMEKLTRLTAKGNEKINIFSAISLLVQDTGFDIRALPAYVNFYGTNFSNTKKITPSKSVAQNMFGTFLEIDYVDSSPKVILQYVGPTSKHLELSDISNKNKFKNDGFDIGNVNNNPIIIAPDVFTKMDFTKSNKVVAFEVSFGDQNQSIFKGVELDQSSIKNTSASFEVLERLGRSETGSSTAQIDIGLFDIYRQSSYQCTVTSMGNVMIQPTMYFYLKNIPLFRGSYFITEVTHNIRTTGIQTSFKGSRIPSQSLPNPTDSFLASYRAFFDRLVKRSKVKVKESALTGDTVTEKTYVTDTGSYSYDMGSKSIPGEKLIQTPGVTEYGIPYNGFDGEKYIQLVEYNGVQWLRAVVCLMDGKIYEINPDTSMGIITRLTTGGIDQPGTKTWADIKEYGGSQNFYATKFRLPKRISADALINNFPITELYNPQNKAGVRITTNISSYNNSYRGPVTIGPSLVGYGMGISRSLAMGLGNINEGDIVYFRLLS